MANYGSLLVVLSNITDIAYATIDNVKLYTKGNIAGAISLTQEQSQILATIIHDSAVQLENLSSQAESLASD